MRRTKQSRSTHRAMRGSALITVTLIGLFIMLVAAALVNNFATSEARAIADSLAKTRIYWASMGHINYALSRIQREGLCDGDCFNNDDDGSEAPTDIHNRADNLRLYLQELNDDGDNARSWNFGDGYIFKLTAAVTDGPLPVPIPDDGRLRAIITLDPVAGTPFDTLNGIEQRIRDQLVVDVCLAAPCNTVSNPNTNGLNQIEGLRRE